MNGGPSGFRNAPATRSFVVASAFLTIVFGARGRLLKLGLSHQDLFENFKLWKVIASIFAFSSVHELVSGLYLLYFFRVFERQIGSNKHSVFILFSILVSTSLEVLASVCLKDPSSKMASGPYGLIFASLVPFYFDIPVSSRFRIFGVNFTDKSFIYLAGLQLLLSTWRRSLVPGICGVLAGLLYYFNAFGIRKLKFPAAIVSLFSQISGPFSSNSSQTPTRNAARNIPSFSGRQVEVNHPSAAQFAVLEPSETSVATLMSMGFDSDSARQALMLAGNDVNVATNILLEAQSR